jgi:23S rRNA (pseudouridine1915-N3)-methyltransferase
MKHFIYAFGHLKKSPEKDLIDQYQKRLKGLCEIKELTVKKDLSGDSLKLAEAEFILASLPESTCIFVLDERGKEYSSSQFATLISDAKNASFKSISYLIGSADGHHDLVRQKAHHLLSFGKMTWPHMLARVMLVEQIYRSEMILQGHPYHRN